MADILAFLKGNGISCDRKTIPFDIQKICDMGMDIEEERSRENRYSLSSHLFTLPELKLLIDAVRSSKFIMAKKSEELIEKLPEFTRHVFDMYDGETKKVTLVCKNDLMNYIVDLFGDKVDTVPGDCGHFRAVAEDSVSQTFFAWVFQFNGDIRITAPEEVVSQRYVLLCYIFYTMVNLFLCLLDDASHSRVFDKFIVCPKTKSLV